MIIRRKNRDSTSSNSAAEVHNADNTIQELPPKKPVMNAYRSVAPTPRSVMMINPITSAPKKEVKDAHSLLMEELRRSAQQRMQKVSSEFG